MKKFNTILSMHEEKFTNSKSITINMYGQPRLESASNVIKHTIQIASLHKRKVSLPVCLMLNDASILVGHKRQTVLD